MTTQHAPYTLIVVVLWHDPADRGTADVFGPFENSAERDEWVTRAEESAVFLHSDFLLTTMSPPLDFDRDDLAGVTP